MDPNGVSHQKLFIFKEHKKSTKESQVQAIIHIITEIKKKHKTHLVHSKT